MTRHNNASFWTATLYTVNGTEPWLLPARNKASINPLPTPPYCRLVLDDYIWLELQDFYEGSSGYTFVFHWNDKVWSLDNNHYGYSYLCERYRALINEYEQDRYPQD